METPNTRSRRKREQEGASSSSSQDDGPSIRWEHDQELLRRAVAQFTENADIAPPTPTQKPRPISSRFSPSVSTSTSITLNTSARPSRKRPCRNNRSLAGNGRPGSGRSATATPASMSPVTPISKLNSLPVKSTSLTSESSGEVGKTRLAQLLEQYEACNISPESGSGSSSRSSNSLTAIPTGSRNLDQKTSLNIGPSKSLSDLSDGIMSRQPSSKSAKTTTTQMQFKDPRKIAEKQIAHPNIAVQTPLVISAFSASTASPDTNAKARTAPITSRPPLSPIKTGAAPRIGLGSQLKPKSNTNTFSTQHHNQNQNSTQPFVRTTSGRGFKPPLLQPQQPVRSSPRRAAQAQAGYRSMPIAAPVRAPAQASPKSIPSKRSRPAMPPHSHSRSSTVSTTDGSSSDLAAVPKTPAHAKAHPFANYDIGENDPDGDTSFDSFDGMFESGGPEIEMLFKQVDGSGSN